MNAISIISLETLQAELFPPQNDSSAGTAGESELQ